MNTSIDKFGNLNINQLGNIINVIGYYVIPYLGVFGLITNGFFMIVFGNLLKKHKIYTFLLAKSFFEFIGSLSITWFYNAICLTDCIQLFPYSLMVFRFVIQRYIGNVFFQCSGFSEVLLAYDRYMMLKNRKNFITRLKPIYLIGFTVGLNLVLYMPDLFSLKAIQITNDTLFNSILMPTAFGSSKFYSIYLISLLGSENLLTCIILVILNILLIYEYKRYIHGKIRKTEQNTSNFDGSSSMIGPSNKISENCTPSQDNNRKMIKKIKKSELRFSKMIIISSLIFGFIRSINLITIIVYRGSEILGWFSINPILIIFIRNINVMLIYSYYTWCILIYSYNDKNFLKKSKSIIFIKYKCFK